MSMEDVLSAINEEHQQNPAAANASRSPRPVVGPDQEVWIRNQVLLAMRMAIALQEAVQVRADQEAFEHGMAGVAEGTAIEIIHTLDMEPSFLNLRRK